MFFNFMAQSSSHCCKSSFIKEATLSCHRGPKEILKNVCFWRAVFGSVVTVIVPCCHRFSLCVLLYPESAFDLKHFLLCDFSQSSPRTVLC